MAHVYATIDRAPFHDDSYSKKEGQQQQPQQQQQQQKQQKQQKQQQQQQQQQQKNKNNNNNNNNNNNKYSRLTLDLRLATVSQCEPAEKGRYFPPHLRWTLSGRPTVCRISLRQSMSCRNYGDQSHSR